MDDEPNLLVKRGISIQTNGTLIPELYMNMILNMQVKCAVNILVSVGRVDIRLSQELVGKIIHRLRPTLMILIGI